MTRKNTTQTILKINVLYIMHSINTEHTILDLKWHK